MHQWRKKGIFNCLVRLSNVEFWRLHKNRPHTAHTLKFSSDIAYQFYMFLHFVHTAYRIRPACITRSLCNVKLLLFFSRANLFMKYCNWNRARLRQIGTERITNIFFTLSGSCEMGKIMACFPAVGGNTNNRPAFCGLRNSTNIIFSPLCSRSVWLRRTQLCRCAVTIPLILFFNINETNLHSVRFSAGCLFICAIVHPPWPWFMCARAHAVDCWFFVSALIYVNRKINAHSFNGSNGLIYKSK